MFLCFFQKKEMWQVLCEINSFEMIVIQVNLCRVKFSIFESKKFQKPKTSKKKRNRPIIGPNENRTSRAASLDEGMAWPLFVFAQAQSILEFFL